jgi:hypothetical protein
MLTTSRINTFILVVLLFIGIAVMAMLANGARGGPLDPPAPPSASGTLPQVEPRRPIPPVGWNGTFPIVINETGSYFLTRDLTTPSGADGISISSSFVTLDLNGFTLDGDTNGSATGVGIKANGPSRRIHVHNGRIIEFRTGVEFPGQDNHVADVTVEQTTILGLSLGQEATARRCVISPLTGRAIVAGGVSLIQDCVLGGSGDGANVGAASVVENNFIIGGRAGGEYGVRANGVDVTIRNNTLENGVRDIGVGGHGAVIIDNVIHCATSIINLGGFSYYAPVSGEVHANQPRYAAGFC